MGNRAPPYGGYGTQACSGSFSVDQLLVPGQKIAAITKVAEMSGSDPKTADTHFFLNGTTAISGDVVTLDPYSVSVFDLKF